MYVHTCAHSCSSLPLSSFLPACRADLSASGLSNSCGLMVNYLYNMSSVTANNQRYLMEHHINAADAVQQLLLRHQHTTTAS